MAVTCSQCGEELLGAVNRCWRCGTPVVAHRGDSTLPPVRRAPVPQAAARGSAAPPEDGVVVAELLGGEGGGSNGIDDGPVVARRVGSPFASPDGASTAASTSAPPVTYVPAVRPDYPQNAGAWGGTIAALFLGVLSFFLAFSGPTSLAALPLSMLGLLMGIWGLYSRRRGMAITAVLLCCLTMAIAGFHTAVLAYEMVYGVSPWEANDPYDPLDNPELLNDEFNQSLEP